MNIVQPNAKNWSNAKYNVQVGLGQLCGGTALLNDYSNCMAIERNSSVR